MACRAVGGIQATSGANGVESVGVRFSACFVATFFFTFGLMVADPALLVGSAFGSDGAGSEDVPVVGDFLPPDMPSARDSSLDPDNVDDAQRRAYDRLVLNAREGMTAPALEYLRQLGGEASLEQQFDHILIASWVGLADEVIMVYDNLPQPAATRALPVNVEIEVARSFRDLKRWPQSLAIWRAGLARSGENSLRFAPGFIMTLADSGQFEEAVRRGRDLVAQAPEREDMREALTYAENALERHKQEKAEREAEAAREAERAKYDALILAAREGDTAPALAFLRGLGYQATMQQHFDHILVASWAGQMQEVVRLYNALPAQARQNLPFNVQAAVARGFRDLKRFSEALVVWREGLKGHPQQAMHFLPGLIMTLSDAGRSDEAVKAGLEYLKNHPDEVDLHMAMAYAYTSLGQRFDVLYHADQALKLAPQTSAVEDEYIRALARAGLSGQALEQARRTGRFPAEQLRAMEADVAALQTRLAAMPTRSEGERFVIADRALALYDQMLADWRALGTAAAADVTRIRIDRLAALHARVRMADLVREYETLVNEGVSVPVWALSNVASAYLYLRQPEKARDLYLAVLADLEAKTPPGQRDHLGPANARLATNIDLLYALAEAEQFDELNKILAEIKGYKPAFLYFKGNPMPAPNEHSIGAQLAVVATDMAKDDTPTAQATMELMVNQAPNNASLRAELAGIYRTRVQPRLAEEHLKLAETIEPRSLDIEIQQGLTALDLQEWRQVEELSHDAITRFPENRTAQRLARLWQVHNMAEFRIDAQHGLATRSNDADSIVGRGDFGVESVLYSKPMQYNWRAFIGGSHAQGTFREGRGYYNTLRGGLEWRSRDLWVEAEVSANRYSNHGSRVGARLSASYGINDHWQIGGSLEYLSRSTPVRALREGIRSDVAQVQLRWRGNERHEVSGSVVATRFSDDNDRLSFNLGGTTRLYTTLNLRLDFSMTASLQHNSEDDDRPYFNPERDLVFLPALRATHRLYRRYERTWEHFVSLSLGAHNQKDYGTDEIWGIAYGQRYRPNDVLEIGATLDLLSRSYDGQREAELRLLVDLTSRF